MTEIMLYFENFPTHYKLVWIVLCLVIFWLLELLVPRYIFSYSKWKHAGVNLIFLATSILINLGMAVLIAWSYTMLENSGFGLFYKFDWPVLVEFGLAFLLLDFVAQYLSHFLLHKVKWMWRFHMVHHSDIQVDVTTGTRHHPGDYLIREFFSLGVIILTGMPIVYYLMYRLITVFFTFWTHANIKLPAWLDKGLSYVVVTPDMHKFHHHFERPWTDTNFGNILSIWDRIFGTFVYADPGQIQFGLDVLDDSTSDRILYQFGLPFDKDVKTDY